MKDIIPQIVEQINSINPKYKEVMALNQTDTAKIIGVSPSTLENWRKDGIGPEWKKVGKRVLYPKIRVAEFLSNTIKTA
jgi:predicted site-specific integrase-resolvase